MKQIEELLAQFNEAQKQRFIDAKPKHKDFDITLDTKGNEIENMDIYDTYMKFMNDVSKFLYYETRQHCAKLLLKDFDHTTKLCADIGNEIALLWGLLSRRGKGAQTLLKYLSPSQVEDLKELVGDDTISNKLKLLNIESMTAEEWNTILDEINTSIEVVHDKDDESEDWYRDLYFDVQKYIEAEVKSKGDTK